MTESSAATGEASNNANEMVVTKTMKSENTTRDANVEEQITCEAHKADVNQEDECTKTLGENSSFKKADSDYLNFNSAQWISKIKAITVRAQARQIARVEKQRELMRTNKDKGNNFERANTM